MTGFAQLIEWKTSRFEEIQKLNDEWRERFPAMGPTRIVSGLREHRSQHHVIFDDPDDVARWQHDVSRHWHVVAWRPVAAGVPHLNDVFQGLP